MAATNFYAIQFPSGRYVEWIDEHWYGTNSSPFYGFTTSTLEKVKSWLKSHFIYQVKFIPKKPQQKVIEWNYFNKFKHGHKKVKLVQQTETIFADSKNVLAGLNFSI